MNTTMLRHMLAGLGISALLSGSALAAGATPAVLDTEACDGGGAKGGSKS